MAHNTVGVNSSFTISGSSAQSAAATHQSEFVRFVAVGASAHVAIGTNPTATAQNYYIPSGGVEVLSIGRPTSQRVVGITTGTSTIVNFPEGTGSQFAVGDSVSLTVTGQSNFNFTHKIITGIDTSTNVSGYFGTKVTVDHDSSSVSDTFASPWAELRSSFKVAALGSGSGTIHFQQVQIAGNA